MLISLFYIFVFPGLLFLIAFGWFAEYYDRKLYARLQNRIGPPWFQPFADFIKLVSKEEVIPDDANPSLFVIMPFLAFAATATAFLAIPIWRSEGLFSFQGDIVVVLYLLTIPTLTFFLGGWYSSSLYSKLGAVRTITQLFACEVPIFICILSAALLADTWQLKGMAEFYMANPLLALANLPGFIVCLIALPAKLEKSPFDIPEAETEIVAGAFTEYSGRLLGIFRLSIDIEMIVASAFIAAVFIPFGFNLHPAIGFALFLVKVLFIVSLLSLARTILARIRIDQMMTFCWKYLAPVSFLQILINLIIKGVFLK
jgi:NADH-quinone oxidoreductase subunit H